MSVALFGAPITEIPTYSVSGPSAVFKTNSVYEHCLSTQRLPLDVDVLLHGQLVFLVNTTNPDKAGDWKGKFLLSIPGLNYHLAKNAQSATMDYQISFQGLALRDNSAKRIRRETGRLESNTELVGQVDVPNVWGYQDVRAGQYLVIELDDVQAANVPTEFYLDYKRTLTDILPVNANKHQAVATVSDNKPASRAGRFIIGTAMENKKKSFEPRDRVSKMTNAEAISYLPTIRVLLWG